MKRREFITLLGGAATASLSHSLATLAQQTQTPIRIGVLPFGSPSNAYDQSLVDAFRSGLRQTGLIEGRDIVLDIVWTTGSDADTDKAVTDLIRQGAALLQLQPLRAEAEFKVGKTGDVAAWPRQTVDDAGGDRIADVREHDGYGAGGLLQCLNAWGGRGQNDVRRERQKLLGISAKTTGIARCPAIVDPHVAPVGPAQLLQSLLESRNAALAFRIVRGQVHQHANTLHALGLLRARRERRGGRAAKRG